MEVFTFPSFITDFSFVLFLSGFSFNACRFGSAFYSHCFYVVLFVCLLLFSAFVVHSSSYSSLHLIEADTVYISIFLLIVFNSCTFFPLSNINFVTLLVIYNRRDNTCNETKKKKTKCLWQHTTWPWSDYKLFIIFLLSLCRLRFFSTWHGVWLYPIFPPRNLLNVEHKNQFYGWIYVLWPLRTLVSATFFLSLVFASHLSMTNCN